METYEADIDTDVAAAVETVNAQPTRYEMRAWRALSNAFVRWRHTAIDTVGTYSGYSPASLSFIRFLRVIPAGEP